MKHLIVLIVLLVSVESHAATGDVLYRTLFSDTTDWATKYDSTHPLHVRTMETSNCRPSGDAKCVKGYHPDSDYGTLSYDANITDTSEITIEWWERYTVWPMTWTSGGCKSIRPYHGSDSANYIGSLITFHGGVISNGLYSSAYDSLTTAVDDAKTNMYIDAAYYCGGSASPYACTVRLAMQFSTDNWTTNGMGTSWRHMREWIKMPTSRTSGDGEVKLWIDDVLIYHSYNVDMHDTGVEPPAITSVRFMPEDEAQGPYEHWYDDITIYEGYVPPGAAASHGSRRSGGGNYSIQ